MNHFIGTWKLVSWESRGTDGKISYPFGKEIVGYIMYGADGFMSVVIAKKNRTKFAAKDFLGGTTTEKSSAYDTYISYCGIYRIKDNMVFHDCELNLYPNWSGVLQERYFKFYDNRLELSTVPISIDGKKETQHLVWERSKHSCPR